MHVLCPAWFLPNSCRSPWDAPHLGPPGRALRRALPRRARRLDGRRRAPVDPGRPRPHHLAAAVDRLGLRARLRRAAAARRSRRRPARPQRVLLIALGVFIVASALGGLVDDGTLLVITRVLKGMSAAFTAPAGLSIITTTFERGPEPQPRAGHLHRDRRDGFSIGLVLGGLLTELGWRWTFLLPVPFALASCSSRAARDPARPAGAGPAPALRRPGRGDLTAAMLLLVRDHRRGAGRRLGGSRDDRARSRSSRAARAVRDHRAPHRRSRSCAWASCARARWCARTSAG